MQSMGSASRIVWAAGIAALLLFYGLYLFFDYHHYNVGRRQDIADSHVKNVAKIARVDNIILGGSNAFFGLSAERLSEYTHSTWYNLALLNEGYRDTAYALFIQSAVDQDRRLLVTKVIYSPVYQFVKGEIKRRKGKASITGRPSFGLMPSMSFISYLKLKMARKGESLDFPLPLAFGDIDFSALICRAQLDHNNYEREELNTAAQWLANNIINFKALFVNAKITLILPSIFYAEDYDAEKAAEDNDLLFAAIDTVLKSKIGNIDVTYIAQPEFPSPDYLCDVRHHGNPKGRAWRTENLIESFEEAAPNLSKPQS